MLQINVPRTCPIWLILLFVQLTAATAAKVACHSCFATCPPGSAENISLCDCTGQVCHAEHCLVKIDIWPDNGVSTIMKGCTTFAHGDKSGCYYAGSDLMVECFCNQPYCNGIAPLNGYQPMPLEPLQCCDCDDLEDDGCNTDSCKSTCEGEYCVADIERKMQTCGFGYPRLLGFLRTSDYALWTKTTTCARYEAGHFRVTHGCTCAAGDECNRLDRLLDSEKSRANTDTPKHFCYTLASIQRQPIINESVFDRASTCEGDFCFIELTTTALWFDEADKKGLMETRYELQAGCLTIDDPQKVAVGCSTEYGADEGMPWRKHCVCDGHMCNYYFQLTRDRMSMLRAFGGGRWKEKSSFPDPNEEEKQWAKQRDRDKQARRVPPTVADGSQSSNVPSDWIPPATRPPLQQGPDRTRDTMSRESMPTARHYPWMSSTTAVPSQNEQQYQADHYDRWSARPRDRTFLEDVEIDTATYDELPNGRLPPMVVSRGTKSSNVLISLVFVLIIVALPIFRR